MSLAIVYTLIVLVFSNIFWYIGYLHPESDSAMFMLMLAQFLPMIVCLIMTKITGEGWNDLGIKIKKKSWKYYGISILVTVCLTYLMDPFMLFVFGKNVETTFTISNFKEIALMTCLGTACCIECLGEELGWIGYLYGKLESSMGILKACTLLGLIRGVYHLGILLHMNYPVQAFIEITITNICLSFFMVYVYKKSESIFACSISHGISAMLPIYLVYSEDWYYTNPFVMIFANISSIIVGVYFLLRCKQLKVNANYERDIKDDIPFDADNQIAVIKCSICTGEQVAGFKSKQDGHFTEVMLIKGAEDLEKFKEMYGITEIKKEY